MDSQDTSQTYGAYYFGHCCGRPYQRDKHWLSFFDAIARRIASDIQPESVLDAGCAMGFLVEALRKQDVAAWGVDISDFAIQKVHPSVKDYCWVGSVTDPFPQQYGLIVCIEVLEHLPRPQSELALENLCRHSDDILFSSTPEDYGEATHFNVQPPEYWAELFARQGFVRDVDFDGSFITPWTTRFRRSQEPLPRLLRNYERRFWQVWKENVELRESSLAMQDQLAANEAAIEQLKVAQVKAQQLDAILHSQSWRTIQRFQRLRLRLIPLESRRERWMNYGIRAGQVLANHGIRGLFRLTYWKYRSLEDYDAWVTRNTLPAEELERQRNESADFSYRPVISFLTPVYNPPPQVLRATIDAVLAQTYSGWELCLVDGGSEDPEVRRILQVAAEEDERIKLTFLKENLGISGNTNLALEEAGGEFIALLDHDDTIAPNLLYEVVRRLNQDPETDLFYHDEDKLSPDGTTRRDPLFKPDWSPEMLLSANYLTHPVIRKSLVEAAGEFDPAFDGAQDWDLVLRCTERTGKVVHIPQVLYHWRQISGSTAASHGAKSYVFDRQLQCVENHLRRSGIENPQASFPKPGVLRVTWPAAGSKVSIIIPTKDKVDYLSRCVNSILRLTRYPDYEIILVDNASSDRKTLSYYKTLADEARVRIVDFSQLFNYSAANNRGAQESSGEILLFLNNDIEVLEGDWLEELARWAERPQIGAVGTKLVYPDNTIQHAGVIIGMQGHASHVFWGAEEGQGTIFGSTDWYRNFTAITGACLMTRRELFDLVGGFDEEYALTFSDTELCIRLVQEGFRIVYTPFARLRHYEGRSRGDFIPAEDILTGHRQLRELVAEGDPYFNPNLSYAHRMPALKPPGEVSREERLDNIVRERTAGLERPRP